MRRVTSGASFPIALWRPSRKPDYLPAELPLPDVHTEIQIIRLCASDVRIDLDLVTAPNGGYRVPPTRRAVTDCNEDPTGWMPAGTVAGVFVTRYRGASSSTSGWARR